jgi:ATP-dependent RNA helicase DDX46/PRP5
LDDDDDEGDRKLQKLDLPDINPEVQSGPSAEEGAIGGDLAAEVVEDNDVKPEVSEAKEEKMDVDPKAEEEDEEDELDAFMRQNNQEVRKVNVKDAVRGGLINYEGESDDEVEIKDAAGDELAKAEALLQSVIHVRFREYD